MAKTKDQHDVVINGTGNLEDVLNRLIKKMQELDRAAQRLGSRDPLTQIIKKEGSAGYATAMEAESTAFVARSTQQQMVREQRTRADDEHQLRLNTLSPGTTPESRAEASVLRQAQRAAARSTAAQATVVSNASKAAYFKDVTIPKEALEKSRHFRRYGNMSTVDGQRLMEEYADRRSARREKEAALASAEYNGMNAMERRLWRSSQTATDRASKIQYTEDLARSEGMTVGEKKKIGLEHRQALNEGLRLRKELNASRREELKQAKIDRANEGMGSAWMGMLPGARMLSAAQRLVPGVAGAVQGAVGFGSQQILAPSLSHLTAGSFGSWASPGMTSAGGGLGASALAPIAGIGSLLGGTALALAAGTVIAGEWGVSQARERFAPSVGRARNLASTLRLGAGAGGVNSANTFLNMDEVGRLTDRGIGTAQMASSYAAFVNARGGARSDAFTKKQAAAGMEEALLWGVDGGLLGQLAAGGAVGMSSKLAGAGVRGGALTGAMGALAGIVGGAASHGLQYNADAYAQYARQMSSSVGGGMYGGALTAQRMAGAGTGLANNMRSNMSSMADMAVLAEAAASGGDYMDIMERMETMTPAQKAAAMSKHLGGDGARYAKFALGESKARAGAAPGADPGAAAPGRFDDLFGRTQERANLAVDRMATASGSMAEQIVKMDAETQANLAQIVENLTLLNSYLEARKATLSTVQRMHPSMIAESAVSSWF